MKFLENQLPLWNTRYNKQLTGQVSSPEKRWDPYSQITLFQGLFFAVSFRGGWRLGYPPKGSMIGGFFLGALGEKKNSPPTEIHPTLASRCGGVKPPWFTRKLEFLDTYFWCFFKENIWQKSHEHSSLQWHVLTINSLSVCFVPSWISISRKASEEKERQRHLN